jgi:pentapeptide MXKDX repeat protein
MVRIFGVVSLCLLVVVLGFAVTGCTKSPAAGGNMQNSKMKDDKVQGGTMQDDKMAGSKMKDDRMQGGKMEDDKK